MRGMDSPFRQPDPQGAMPEPPPPLLHLTPRYAYELPARRTPAIWLAMCCAVTAALFIDAAYGMAGGLRSPWGLVVGCGWIPVSIGWLSWAVLRRRFALELEPEAGRLLVLRCPWLPFGRWDVDRDLHLSDVDAVDVRWKQGLRCAVLVLGQGTPRADEVNLGWVRNQEHVNAIAHWIEQARVITAKHRGLRP